MQKAKDIMEELGFRAEGSDATKIAFLRNLFRQAYGVDVPFPKELCVEEEKGSVEKGVQLSFFGKANQKQAG